MRRRRTLFVDSDILVVGGGMSGCGVHCQEMGNSAPHVAEFT
jgi:glycerol-3-phosphate dehydrogenase